MKKIPGVDDVTVSGRYDVDTGEYRIRHSQPIDPVKQLARHARHKSEALGIRKDAGLIRAAAIPLPVALKIKEKYGIDPAAPGNQANFKRLLSIIESEYPDLKTVNFKIG